jgi:AraC-like DNA-binding protein
VGAGDHAVVLPDGCRDLIGIEQPGHTPVWFVSELASHSHAVAAPVGQRFVGYRLQPGCEIDEPALLARLSGTALDDSATALQALHDWTALNADVRDALAMIAAHPLRASQGELGIGERSLQRLLSGKTRRPPVFWRRLARWRLAMRELSGPKPLAEIAVDTGHADQAHMTREFRAWLGLTPGQARRSAALLATARKSGYGP